MGDEEQGKQPHGGVESFRTAVASVGGDASPRPLTLREVGRLAGVSTATASMALSDHPRVAAATKEAVRRAARQLDYVPNSMGRGLRARRLGAIGLVVPHSGQHVFSHPYFMSVLAGIAEVANRKDLALIVSTSVEEEDSESAYLKILRSRRADGVIVASAAIGDPNVSRLALSGYPVVFLGRYPYDPRLTAVGVDDRGGAEQATLHLLDAHRLRRVAHISGPLGHLSSVDRFEGYREALGRRGLAFDEHLVVEGDYSQGSGEAGARALLEAGVPFDGIFAANDEMAVGASLALRRAGRRVPGDVALVGFDDITLAAVVRPGLTTVRQPIREMGHIAADRLLALIDGAEPEPPQLELATELVIRGSCGCMEPDADDLI